MPHLAENFATKSGVSMVSTPRPTKVPDSGVHATWWEPHMPRLRNASLRIRVGHCYGTGAIAMAFTDATHKSSIQYWSIYKVLKGAAEVEHHS